MREQPKNRQSGEPTVENTVDTSREVASMGEREGVHFEDDPDQIVKVSHQVNPGVIASEGATTEAHRGLRDDTSNKDARVTPTASSVHEAGPPRR